MIFPDSWFITTLNGVVVDRPYEEHLVTVYLSKNGFFENKKEIIQSLESNVSFDLKERMVTEQFYEVYNRIMKNTIFHILRLEKELDTERQRFVDAFS